MYYTTFHIFTSKCYHCSQNSHDTLKQKRTRPILTYSITYDHAPRQRSTIFCYGDMKLSIYQVQILHQKLVILKTVFSESLQKNA
jgi:hypothetical protein